MRILVTGGAGFIGSQVAKMLHLCNHTPIVFDSLYTGHKQAVQWGPFIHQDLSDIQAIKKALKEHEIDAVMHFAALTNVRESFTEPALYYAYNVGNTINLLSAMSECNIQTLLFSSSCAVYGIPITFPVSEKMPLDPINPYGKTKLMCEEIMADFPNINYVAFRYFNAAGADLDGELGEMATPPAHLIPIVCHAAIKQVPLELFGNTHPTHDGSPVRDYIHVVDLAHAHLNALDYLTNGGKSIVLNLGTGTPYSVFDVIKEVETQSNQTITLEIKPAHPGEPPHLECDYQLAEKILDWSPTHSSLSQLVKDTLTWQTRHD